MDEEKLILGCIFTLSCPSLLWEAMTFVSHHWGYASRQNLTNLNRNRQAWLGQAACLFLDGAPEYVTKLAWARLSAKQQSAANTVADNVISDWENKYRIGYFEWQKKH